MPRKRSRAEEEALKMLYPEPNDRRAELRQNAEPALQEELDRIQSWLEENSRRSISSFYELGKRLQMIRNEAHKRTGGRYGAYAIEIIEEYFGWSEGYIRNALETADSFTEDEIQEYSSMQTADGEPVSVRHLLILSRVKDRKKRQDLIAQTTAAGWRSWELGEAVDKAVAKPPRPEIDGRGRPLAAPRNFDDLLHQQERAAKDFVNRAENRASCN